MIPATTPDRSSGSTSNRPPRRRGRVAVWAGLLVFLPLIYVASCGPVLALAFVLRESTGYDQFYLVMWLYYPLLAWDGPDSIVAQYIELWCEMFGTVGPG